LPEIHLEVYKIIMGERTTLTKEIDVNKKRKYLLYVNPVGGSGAALRIWNRVKNLFSISDIEIQVFKTQHYKHAFEHTLDMNFRKYDGIICCSGDGIVHEVINAICHREDREEFVHSVPIGVLPGGTSNGLAKVICESSGEICTPENCAYIISKGCVKEMDLLECELLSEDKKIFAFLSVAWGIIADIDLESEVCRCCGPFRYSLYGAFRWMCLRKTFAAVYHLPQDSLLEDKEIPSLRSPIDDTIFTRENEQFYYFLACNVSHIGESIHCAPRAKIDDGFIDLIKMKKQGGKRNLLKQLFNQDSGDYFTTNGDLKQGSGLEYVKTKAFRIVPKNNLEEDDNPTENRNLPFFYSIDGERYPVEPLQVKVLRKAIKIFCLNK
jgi:sphingosine kinase